MLKEKFIPLMSVAFFLFGCSGSSIPMNKKHTLTLISTYETTMFTLYSTNPLSIKTDKKITLSINCPPGINTERPDGKTCYFMTIFFFKTLPEVIHSESELYRSVIDAAPDITNFNVNNNDIEKSEQTTGWDPIECEEDFNTYIIPNENGVIWAGFESSNEKTINGSITLSFKTDLDNIYAACLGLILK